MKAKPKPSLRPPAGRMMTAMYLAAMAGLYLLYPGRGGYGDIVNEKLTLYWCLTGGYLLALFLWAGWALHHGARLSLRRYLRTCTWPERFCLIYLVLTWVSALASPWFPETILGVSRWEGALNLTLYAVSFLLVARLGAARPWLLWIWSGAVALCATLALIQLTGANPLGLYPAGMNYYDKGVKYSGAYLGTIGNVDLLAGVLSLAAALFWVTLLRGRSRQRLWLLPVLAMTLAVLGAMGVMAALVAVAGGALVSLPVALPVEKSRRKWFALVVAVALLAVLAAVYIWDGGAGVWHEAHLLLHGQAEDSFGSGRIYIWRRVLELTPQRLWLGAGPDTMAYAEIAPFTRYDADLGVKIISHIDAAHNEYLNVLYHQGAPALAAYLLMLVMAAWQWLRCAGGDGVAAALGAAVLAYSIQAFFGISMVLVAPFFWLTLGLLVARCRAETAVNACILQKEA